MKIDTLGVQAFVAIADHGSFSRAAQALHITQTGLTRRLQNLEAFLGVKLVERTTISRPRSPRSARPARRCAAT
jgi:DNA-binding transcriptional LysR family regulator